MTLIVGVERTAATAIRKSFNFYRDRSWTRVELYRGELARQEAALAVLPSREPQAGLGYVVGALGAQRATSEPFYMLAVLSTGSGAQDAAPRTEPGTQTEPDQGLRLFDKISDPSEGRDTYPDIVINPGIPLDALTLDADCTEEEGSRAASGGATSCRTGTAEGLRAVLSVGRLLFDPHAYAVLGIDSGDKLTQTGRNLISQLAETHAALADEYREPLGEAERVLLDRTAAALKLSRVQRDRLYYEAEAHTIRARTFPKEMVERYLARAGREAPDELFAKLTESLRRT